MAAYKSTNIQIVQSPTIALQLVQLLIQKIWTLKISLTLGRLFIDTCTMHELFFYFISAITLNKK